MTAVEGDGNQSIKLSLGQVQAVLGCKSCNSRLGNLFQVLLQQISCDGLVDAIGILIYLAGGAVADGVTLSAVSILAIGESHGCKAFFCLNKLDCLVAGLGDGCGGTDSGHGQHTENQYKSQDETNNSLHNTLTPFLICK